MSTITRGIPAAPCKHCGTLWGHQPHDHSRPARPLGLCTRFYKRRHSLLLATETLEPCTRCGEERGETTCPGGKPARYVASPYREAEPWLTGEICLECKNELVWMIAMGRRGRHYPDDLAARPTSAEPGSPDKVKVLAARLERLMPLFHPRDLSRLGPVRRGIVPRRLREGGAW